MTALPQVAPGVNRDRATPLDLLKGEHLPLIEVNPQLLSRVISELLMNHQAPAGWFEAIVHIPTGKGNVLRENLRLKSPFATGKVFQLALDSGAAEVAEQLLGIIPARHPLRRGMFCLIAREEVCAVVAEPTPEGGEVGDQWIGAISVSPSDVKMIASFLAGALKQEIPELNYSAESLAAKIEQFRRLYDGKRQSRLIGPVIAAIGSEASSRFADEDRDSEWNRKMNRFYQSVVGELDQVKFNGTISRTLKRMIGYEYLEVVWSTFDGRKSDAIPVFSRNDTGFGGDLLSVILQPKLRGSISRGGKPITFNTETASQVLMNPRLMSLMNLRSGIILPLRHQGRGTGILKLLSRRDDFYQGERGEQLDMLGRIIGRLMDNIQVHSRMRRMAILDGLTNVSNHRFFAEQIEREFKRARRYGANLTLLMIDIDRFKDYNDTYGHLQGDRVLAMVAQLFESNVREVDIVSRYGGEEFTILLPETDLEQGMIVAEKIRKSIEESTLLACVKNNNEAVTVSIGVADMTPEVDGPTELVNRADTALYRAKKLGRNRCETY